MTGGPLSAISNGPAALVIAAGALHRQLTATGPGSVPQVGLTMWFRVRVTRGGTTADLQDWSECGGLGVTLTPEEGMSGGRNGIGLFLPGTIKYPNVTLTRAVSQKGSPALIEWLNEVARAWTNGTDAPAGATVVIDLFSSLGSTLGTKVITRWTLHDAVPVSWSGPSLNAKGGEIATEKLVIAHRGFLEHAASGSAGDGPKFVLVDEERKTVEFDYAPTKITVRQGVGNGSGVLQSADDSGAHTQSDRENITVSALRLEGSAAIRKNIPTLQSWLVPKEVTASAASADEPNRAPTETAVYRNLTMRMGTEGITKTVTLRSVTVDYPRSSPTGEPVRAQVTIALQVER